MSDYIYYIFYFMDQSAREKYYPSWMKELIVTENDYNQRLGRVKEKQKTLTLNLQKFDEKQEQQEQKFKQMRIQKLLQKHEEQKQQEIQQKMKKEQQNHYYEDQKHQQNQKNKIFKINIYLLTNIISFLDDQICVALKLQRVCKRWKVTLESEYIWSDLVRDYLGSAYLSFNKTSEMNYKGTCIFFRRRLLELKQFFENHRKSNFKQDIVVKQQVQDTLSALKFLQQLLCLNSKGSILKELKKLESLLRYSLESLCQSTYYMIRDDARQAFISLIRVFKLKPQKLFQDEEDLLTCKQILNQEVLPKLPETDIFFVATVFYFWTASNELQGNLRSYEIDNYKIQMLYVLNQKTETVLYLYNRYKDLLDVYFCVVEFDATSKKFKCKGQGPQREKIELEGSLSGVSFEPKYTEYDLGVKEYGKCAVSIALGAEYGFQSYRFQVYLVFGCRDGGEWGLYLIGNNENTNVFFMKI